MPQLYKYICKREKSRIFYLEHLFAKTDFSELIIENRKNIRVLVLNNFKIKNKIYTGAIIMAYSNFFENKVMFSLSENFNHFSRDEQEEFALLIAYVIYKDIKTKHCLEKSNPFFNEVNSLLTEMNQLIEKAKLQDYKYFFNDSTTVKTVNPMEISKNQSGYSKNFKRKLEYLFKMNKTLEAKVMLGLAISRDRYNKYVEFESNFMIIPVIIDFNGKKPLVKKYYLSQIEVESHYNLDLQRYARIFDIEFTDRTNLTRSKMDNLNLLTPYMWNVFCDLPENLRYFLDGKTFYPAKLQTVDSLKCEFFLKSAKSAMWELKLSLATKKSGSAYLGFFVTNNTIFIAEKIDKEIMINQFKHPKLFTNLMQDLKAGNEFHYKEVLDFKAIIEKELSDYVKVVIDEKPVIVADYKPVPVLYLDKKNSVQLVFDYNPNKQAKLRGQKIIDIPIDKPFQQKCFELLCRDEYLDSSYYYLTHQYKPVPPYQKGEEFYFSTVDGEQWISEMGDFYISLGFEIYSMKTGISYKKQTSYSVSSKGKQSTNWFEFKPVLINEENGEEFEVSAVNFSESEVKDSNNQFHQVNQDVLEKLKKMYSLGTVSKEGIRVPSENTILASQFSDSKNRDEKVFKEIAKSNLKYNEFDHIKSYKVSDQFKGVLRNYQKAGFDWLSFLNEYNFNGCLADDMGLGKTVQTLALLQTLKSQKKLGKVLLIVPLSAIPNWQDEIEKFTSNLKVYTLFGKNSFDSKAIKPYDIILTGYATLRQRFDTMLDYEFDYIILDESQNIKNYTTLTAQAVKSLKSKHRLALSGTPIENNLSELWSLFDFLMPGFLGSIDFFKPAFIDPIVNDKDEEKITLLKKMLFPFILRRKKSDVDIDLPEKNEILVHVEMSDEIEKVYGQYARQFKASIDESIEKDGLQKSAIKIFEALLRLRQLCLFPSLVDKNLDSLESPKFDYLTDLLEDILKEDHKVLIFSQFTGVLDLIEPWLKNNQYNFVRLDGSTSLKKRDKYIEQFQNDEKINVFLLSLKSGGVALNLTAADYVVIFDPWWNPAVEAQAIDRAHRMGQQRKVIAYRLIVKNSIEDKIIKLQESKKELVESLISEDKSLFKSLNKKELLELFE